MEKQQETKTQQPTTTNKKQLMLEQIKETPFCYATDGEKSYVTCGKVLIETDKTIENIKEEVENYPWPEIGLFIQAVINELTETNNNKNK